MSWPLSWLTAVSVATLGFIIGVTLGGREWRLRVPSVPSFLGGDGVGDEALGVGALRRGNTRALAPAVDRGEGVYGM